MNSAKSVLLSALYFLVLLILIALINFGLQFLLNSVVFNVLNWFNKLSLIWEIVILVVGGFTLFLLIFHLFSFIGQLIKTGLLYFLPINSFTATSALVLAVLNSLFDCFYLWKSPSHFSTLIVIEL